MKVDFISVRSPFQYQKQSNENFQNQYTSKKNMMTRE